MAIDVIMPQMGESIFEGTITKWLKKVGDAVQKDEPLLEISTDKVDAEIPSPSAGVLSEIKFTEGATVQINTVIAVIGGEVSNAATAPVAKVAAPDGVTETVDKAPAKTATPEAAAQLNVDKVGAAAETSAGGSGAGTEVVMPQMGESIFEGTITKWLKKAGDTVQKDEPLFEISTDKVDAEIPAPVTGVLSEIRAPEGATVQINTVVAVIGGAGSGKAAPAPAAVSGPGLAKPASTPAPTHTSEGKLPAPAAAGMQAEPRSSPLVRRIARDNNLDLAQIPGTGSSGRITKDDVLKHLAEYGAGSVPAAKVAPPAGLAAQAAQRAVAAASASASGIAAPGELVPLSRMRAIIAQRMVESVQVSPHVYTVFKVDMTRIVKLREREKAKYEQRNGVKLTYMPFIAAAAIHTLRKFPIVNASMEGSGADLRIRYHRNINLGIAVALDWGLIVPVIHQAEDRSFLGLARAVADLAERARTKRLKPEEVQGSTFTLTNSGIFGEEFGTPIINQPDSAIMAIGGLKKEPVVLTDAEGNDTIAIRSTQHFCLGFDHRIIDGADGGKFMAEFKKTLENWDGDIG
ncbi:2-oxoglutarate dehydrogenase, E2 component, dihydrolipoamide succinyltransferase [Acidicapsa dinghuensis]|uniref:Dihydrolipoamide acetyltransferase component of pyruvate dehydrogenase complex n=1 Tax=Acidicapsa dinghuensis TaxID=2218256 RepID=A0ABW1EM61_9BACT|nr:2-oxoglutarate dehydrogenase, E2 component, dihydrolipoamide succinyltransferase [Acidicapsa dinghuensis]